MCLLTAAHYFSLLKISTQHTLGYYYWVMLVFSLLAVCYNKQKLVELAVSLILKQIYGYLFWMEITDNHILRKH